MPHLLNVCQEELASWRAETRGAALHAILYGMSRVLWVPVTIASRWHHRTRDKRPVDHGLQSVLFFRLFLG